MAHRNQSATLHGHTVESYHLTQPQTSALANFITQAFSYVLARNQNINEPEVIGLQDYMQCTSEVGEVNQTEMTYLQVMDKKADNKETILEVLSWLHKEFKVGKSVEHFIVAGDAKIYTHMITIKKEYGETLNWLVVFPGDFRLLCNYQEVLITAYCCCKRI